MRRLHIAPPSGGLLKILYSQASPFVRKCLVAAHELGLYDRIERVPVNAHPVNRDPTVVASNPLGKVPALMTDDGATIFDSRVICEYLDAKAGHRLIPRDGPERWQVLTAQSLADGIMDAGVLTRYETFARPEALRWSDWTKGQLEKVNAALTEFERRAAQFGDRVDIGLIALGAALGYLDFRFASLAWRERHPNTAAWYQWFSGRDSMVATRPPQA
jgi:glutathione S-transferase